MNSSKKVLEISGMESLMLSWASQCISNTEKISCLQKTRERELIETFLGCLEPGTEPESSVPFRINGVNVLYLEYRLLLGSYSYGPWIY